MACGVAGTVGIISCRSPVGVLRCIDGQDNALATLVVYQPASVGGKLQLMEMRNSPDWPFLFMAWLDPVSGNSTMMPLPDDWYLVCILCVV